MTPKFLGYTRAAAAAVIGLNILATAQASAQTMIGKPHSASVSVDLSVLNQLGNTPTVPQILHPSVRSLLMPNSRQPKQSRSTSIGLSRSTPLSAPIGTIRLKPPTKAKKRAAPSQTMIRRKSPAKARVVMPAAPKIPPQPRTAITRTVEAPPPPMRLSKPVAKPLPPAKQIVALTRARKPNQQFRLEFGIGSAEIGDGTNITLDRVVQMLKRDENLRLQLLAYAGGGNQTPSQARRLSLSRALAVRSRLIEKGIRSTRIDVRALGKKSEGGPPDRIDITISAR